MPLQSFGQITMQDVAAEFRKPSSNIKLSDYYKNYTDTQPFESTVNLKIPFGPAKSGNEIKLSDFYGSAWYGGYFYFKVVGEAQSTYGTANDGYWEYSFTGCTSPTIQIQIGSYIKTYYGESEGSDSRNIGDCHNCTYVMYFTDCRGTYSSSRTGTYGRGYEEQTVDLVATSPNFQRRV